MPRIARMVVPGLPHHIIQRGNRRQRTFFHPGDYRVYLKLLGKASVRHGLEICAYCLMPNHVHVIGVPSEVESLSRTFSEVHSGYSRRINRRNEWQGHLWQERFHSFVMDERHLLGAVRYILQNPVRGGAVKTPEAWPYSSTRVHMGLSNDPIVNPDLLDGLVEDWGGFLRTEPQPTEVDRLVEHTDNGLPLGSESFVEALEKRFRKPLRPRGRGRPRA